ncbi:MAG TPA: ABC transporter substrate-binding protein [Planctomycetota bacterium]|nr:ABC transporter substrate-binding protein [Planctomycetota bacterium]
MTIIALGAIVAWPSPAPVAADGREVVRFWHIWTGEWKVVVDRIVERFNRDQDRYQVVALSIPTASAEQKFLMSVAGGDPPDVMAQLEQVVPAWASQGLIQPLEGMMAGDEWQAFQRDVYPVALKVGMYQGRLYALTIGINTWACFYRPDHLRDAGLADRPFPESLEELAAWGRRLHRHAPDGRLVRMGFWPTWVTQYAPRFGGGWWDDAAQRLTLDTPANRAALEFVAGWAQELGFDRVVRFQSSLNTGGFATQWPFISGEYSIVMDGQWRIEQLARYAPELVYATAPLPPAAGHSRGAGYAAANFLCIPTGARNAAGAFAFMRYWSGVDDPERAAEFHAWGGWLPSSPRVTAARAYQDYLRRFPQMRTFVDILPSAELQTAPPVPYQVYLLDKIRRAEDAAVRGTKTPAEALADLERAVGEEVERRARLGAPP